MLSESFNIQTLRAVKLFSPLSDDELEHIRPALTIRDCNIGDILMQEGEIGDDLYVLLGGEVKVVAGHRTEAETVLSTMEPIEVFGEMSLLSDAPRSATIIATDTCRFIVVTKEALENVLLEHPAICLALLHDAYRRLLTLTKKVGSN
jgi:CRP-like cAMP-binding protein